MANVDNLEEKLDDLRLQECIVSVSCEACCEACCLIGLFSGDKKNLVK